MWILGNVTPTARQKLKILNSDLVKCLTISSSLMFSGRFPTHKWRVSRTILFMNNRPYLVKAVRSIMALRTAAKRHIFQPTFQYIHREAETSQIYLQRIMGDTRSRDIKSSLIGHFLTNHQSIYFWPMAFGLLVTLPFSSLTTALERSPAIPCQWHCKICSVD